MGGMSEDASEPRVGEAAGEPISAYGSLPFRVGDRVKIRYTGFARGDAFFENEPREHVVDAVVTEVSDKKVRNALVPRLSLRLSARIVVSPGETLYNEVQAFEVTASTGETEDGWFRTNRLAPVFIWKE